MYLALLASALLVGALLAVQAAANLQLTRAVGTPYGASTRQLVVATGLLLALAVAAGAVGAIGLAPAAPAWHLLGGLASPLYITTGILLFPRLGALATVGLFVTGQVLASLCLDGFGLLGLDRRPLGAGRGGRSAPPGSPASACWSPARRPSSSPDRTPLRPVTGAPHAAKRRTDPRRRPRRRRLAAVGQVRGESWDR